MIQSHKTLITIVVTFVFAAGMFAISVWEFDNKETQRRANMAFIEMTKPDKPKDPPPVTQPAKLPIDAKNLSYNTSTFITMDARTHPIAQSHGWWLCTDSTGKAAKRMDACDTIPMSVIAYTYDPGAASSWLVGEHFWSSNICYVKQGVTP